VLAKISCPAPAAADSPEATPEEEERTGLAFVMAALASGEKAGGIAFAYDFLVPVDRPDAGLLLPGWLAGVRDRERGRREQGAKS